MRDHAQRINDFDEGEWFPVQSSNLCCVAYDDDFQDLTIHFVNGRVYTYVDVPAWLVRKMLLARSIGSFFFRRVRSRFAFTEGQFEYEKVTA